MPPGLRAGLCVRELPVCTTMYCLSLCHHPVLTRGREGYAGQNLIGVFVAGIEGQWRVGDILDTASAAGPGRATCIL